MNIRESLLAATTDPITPEQLEKYVGVVLDAMIEENESLLSVAEHEIGLADHCEMHSKYSSYCHACKKRKWYGEISKDWKRVIDERIEILNELKSKKEES